MWGFQVSGWWLWPLLGSIGRCHRHTEGDKWCTRNWWHCGRSASKTSYANCNNHLKNISIFGSWHWSSKCWSSHLHHHVLLRSDSTWFHWYQIISDFHWWQVSVGSHYSYLWRCDRNVHCKQDRLFEHFDFFGRHLWFDASSFDQRHGSLLCSRSTNRWNR